MKFRQPERLEKWIAYDGALGTDLLVAETQADADSDTADEFAFVEASADAGGADIDVAAYAFPGACAADAVLTVGDDAGEEFDGGSGRITVTIPGNADADDYLPFIKDESIFYATSGVDAEDVYFEISMPGGGTLGFHEVASKGASLDKYSHDEAYDFIDANGQVLNGDIVMIDGGDRVMFMYEENGKYFLQEYRLVDENNGGNSNDRLAPVENGAKVEVMLPGDGHGLRFHVTDTGGRSTAQVLNAVFRSLTYEANNNGGSIPSFDVTAYYNTSEQPGQFTDAEGGMYDPGNENVVVDSTDPDFEHITHGNLDEGGGGGGGEGSGPGPGPGDGDGEGNDEGGDDLEFVPVPGGGDSGADDGGGEGTDEGGDDSGKDGGDDSGSDADGDSGSDAGQGDDMGFVFQDEEDVSGGDDSADDADSEAREDAAPVVEPRGNEERAAESAAEAQQMELARDMEFMLTAVRNERAVLLGLIGRLQSEYLSREPAEYGELRGYLRRLFDMGGREQETVNRIIDAMNREMEVFRGTAPGHRDGMLSESVRELIDSAERHSGEMGAYSQAIEAVADLLAARRNDGLPPPAESEVEALFAEKYEEAMSGWLANAERMDPMGRELTAAQRVGGMAQGE